MFRIVTGTMGGGKSYYVAEVILQALKQGATVHICGVDLLKERLDELGFTERVIWLENDPTKWEAQIIAGVEGTENLLVCDEATLLFHTRTQAKRKTEDFDTVYQMLVWSRRYGLDVYFVAQHLMNIDAATRRMVGEIIACVDGSKIPVLGPFLATVKGRFLRKRLSPAGKEMWRSWHRPSQEVFDFYDTHGFAGRTVNVNRNVTRTTPRNYAAAKVFGVIAAVAAIPVICFWFLGISLDAKSEAHATKQALRATNEPPSAPKPWQWSTDPASSAYVPLSGPGGVPGARRVAPVIALEWADEDELRIGTITVKHTLVSITAHDGRLFSVGASIDGDIIERLDVYGGRYYFTARAGRIYCLRQITPKERNDLWNSRNNSSPQPPQASPLPLPTFSLFGSSPPQAAMTTPQTNPLR
jgi:hypothetical protein